MNESKGTYKPISTSGAEALASRVLARDYRAAARLISLIENGHALAVETMEYLQVAASRSHRIGITGPPGAGKSTLVAGLAQRYRASGAEVVGVIAVDPTSPFSGGAILGDRVRMMGRGHDPGVFIRSMASRGAFGGLCPAAADAMDVLSALGCDPVLAETVGVGQSEVDVVSVTDTTVLVLSPEAGDGVQVMKAGIMEAADIFVVNKADREGAKRMARSLEQMLPPMQGFSSRSSQPSPSHVSGRAPRSLQAGDRVWQPKVILCVASNGEGIDEVVSAIRQHRSFLVGADGARLMQRRQRGIELRVRSLVEAAVRRDFWNAGREDLLRQFTQLVAAGQESPHSVARRLLERPI